MSTVIRLNRFEEEFRRVDLADWSVESLNEYIEKIGKVLGEAAGQSLESLMLKMVGEVVEIALNEGITAYFTESDEGDELVLRLHLPFDGEMCEGPLYDINFAEIVRLAEFQDAKLFASELRRLANELDPPN